MCRGAALNNTGEETHNKRYTIYFTHQGQVKEQVLRAAAAPSRFMTFNQNWQNAVLRIQTILHNIDTNLNAVELEQEYR